MNRRAAVSSLFLFGAIVALSAQSDGFDPETVAMTFHKVSGAPLDTQAMAAQSQAAMRASGFDRPDVIAAEQRRLDAQLASMNPAREFTITIDDTISQYDHTSGQFSVELFTPGTFIPIRAFNREYRVVFANAASARAIAMSKEQAREFDARLTAMGRQVNTEVSFKVVGKGDPVGGVMGDLVIRGEIISARVLDKAGQVVFTPKVMATSAMPVFAGFDSSKADVAGLRVGVSKKDMEATLTRLFGKVTPGYMSGDGKFKGFTSVIEVNSMGCRSGFMAKKKPQPGAVCVTAYLDSSDIVRMVRVERLFPPGFDGRVFERALVQKYGPASGSRRGSSWGPGVPGAVLNNPSITVDALTASAAADHDISDLGGNRLQNVIVSLQLIDANWAKQFAQ
jgi:predicted aconitase with swiveling domain